MKTWLIETFANVQQGELRIFPEAGRGLTKYILTNLNFLYDQEFLGCELEFGLDLLFGISGLLKSASWSAKNSVHQAGVQAYSSTSGITGTAGAAAVAHPLPPFVSPASHSHSAGDTAWRDKCPTPAAAGPCPDSALSHRRTGGGAPKAAAEDEATTRP